ncbi:MAG: hypothetical protein F4X57_11610 [Chloroflexi bacterium]|nr:hypothetical protein [Chloroflexota bacterium]
MKPNEYGENYSAHLLEQYKLYVEMADRISQRRDQSNRFYASLLAGMIALLVILARLNISNDVWAVVFLVGGLFGSFLSVVWLVNIRSYRSLNTAKFTVINKLEKSLPAQGYSDEWNLLRPPDDSPKYFQLTRVEQFIPVIMFLLFFGLVIYSVAQLIFDH